MESPEPKLPVVALVLSVVGLCLPPVGLLAFALGLYGYLRARRDPAWAPRKQLTQLTMAVSAAGLLIFTGMMVSRLKQLPVQRHRVACGEVLKSLYRQQQQFKQQHGRYTTRLAELPQPPSPGPYLVRLAGEGPLSEVGLAPTDGDYDALLPTLLRPRIGMTGECPACQLTMLCAGQLDGDPTLDITLLSTHVNQGQPVLDSDDMQF